MWPSQKTGLVVVKVVVVHAEILCGESGCCITGEQKWGKKGTPRSLAWLHEFCEPLPSSSIRSRFLPCLWADGRLEEWTILAQMRRVSHEKRGAAGPSRIPVESWILRPLWTTWTPGFTLFNAWTWALSTARLQFKKLMIWMFIDYIITEWVK